MLLAAESEGDISRIKKLESRRETLLETLLLTQMEMEQEKIEMKLKKMELKKMEMEL